ncbi:pyroglutamyl-peptidase I [Thermoflavimicrobium daqui]|jgi:pyroglutamyl-peptidase|uniref:Pyrrolidone-carboxylate peptidase n=1 Tax=Thermoflavimicrobium daqui TaxID=2137476 RepID=A0A364K8X5_9BACL|nr:pyroglutamyl-peptidase I [Thermoflavimicrobium daqui]RAL26756.1 pyroglutamyl-peptidase I [Thermoflavimicrobium daqui]
MKKVLLTGFTPFAGESLNSSWEVVRQLQSTSLTNAQVYIVQVPTVFQKSLKLLQEKIAQIRPEIVICVGQAGGRCEIAVERVALNIDDARIPDNDGYQPIDQPVIPDGPNAYWSTLPTKAIVKQIRLGGIPATVSYSAGTFVCNHLFYGLAHEITTKYPKMKGGLIHIPYLPNQVNKCSNLPSMSLDISMKAIEIAILTSIEMDKDMEEAGGTLA